MRCRPTAAGGLDPAALLLPLAILLGGCEGGRIDHPERLWLLWLVPLAAAGLLVARRRAARRLERFAAPSVLGRLAVGRGRPRRAWSGALRLSALAALLLALAGVQYGYAWEEMRREGVDLVVAVDVSASMLAEDAGAGDGLTRIERARRELVDLLDALDGDRVGLVAFAGTAFLECPLTLDYDAFALFVGNLDTELIPVQGTDLGAALDTAVQAFETSPEGSRAVLLLTDGEDHAGDVEDAAARAKAAGVPVFVIGIGSPEGAPVPGASGFRRDRSGEMILTRLDERALRTLAVETGGVYVRSVSGDLDLEAVYRGGIRATLEARELESRRERRWYDRFQWLIAFAVLALMSEGLMP